jgi:hypothetical protein
MPELHPVLQENGKYNLPVACYNLELEKRRGLCTFVKNLKVPIRFLVNPKKLVSIKDLHFTTARLMIVI